MWFQVGLFLIFTQFYSPFVCYQNPGSPSCQTAGNHNLMFTIHGLWPEYTNDTYPSYCNQSAYFNESKLKPILDDLNTYWLNYESYTPEFMYNYQQKNNSVTDNPSFWKHEYLKHATCYPNVTELEFFNKTLNLYHQVDSTKTLETNFSPNIIYSKQKVNQVMNGIVQCSNPSISLQNTWEREDWTPHWLNQLRGLNSYVVQLWKCYTLDLKPITCPEWLDRSCQSDVVFFG